MDSCNDLALQEPDLSPDAEIVSSPAEIELLPGLEGICNELLQEDGYGLHYMSGIQLFSVGVSL